MKVLKPSYYNSFRCIANKCSESCCAGWQVSIDKKSYNKYKRVKGIYSKELVKGISRNRKSGQWRDYGRMLLTEDKKCIFLNQEGLCDIYINIGPDYLCNTCKIYPRIIGKFGDIVEKDLTLSCPEVVRIILAIEDKIKFIMEEEKLSPLDLDNINNKYGKSEVYDLFWKSRLLFIEISQFREMELWKRLVFLKYSSEKIQNIILTRDYKEIDNVINNLIDSVTNEKVIKSLDDIKGSNKVKNLFINTIINMRIKENVANRKFSNLLNELYEIIGDNNDNVSEDLKEMETEFDLFFEGKDYILENFIVNNIYVKCMRQIENRNIDKSVTMTILEYALFKRLLQVKWYSNNKKLENDDIIEVMYSFYRVIEHSNFMNKLYDKVKEAGYDSLAYLTILIK